jgi:hypothetical protein
MNDDIDISDFDKVDVLCRLHAAARQQGLGRFQPDVPITPQEASDIIENRLIEGAGLYFDYLGGRVMKVDIAGDTLNPRLYDRDNGEGAAARALADEEFTMRVPQHPEGSE